MVVNGNKAGDWEGEYTYIVKNGKSVVDLM